MSAQVYHLINKLENIPPNVLNNIDKMAMDECLLLTELEGEYFNALCKEKKEFDMRGKKVGFIRGNAGTIKSNKKEYFTTEKLRKQLRTNDNNEIYFGVLYIFNAPQKAESGGYDAVVVYGSKKLLSTKEVIKRLKNNR